MFQRIQELIDDSEALVGVLIDEVILAAVTYTKFQNYEFNYQSEFQRYLMSEFHSFFTISVLLDTGGESDSGPAVGHVR